MFDELVIRGKNHFVFEIPLFLAADDRIYEDSIGESQGCFLDIFMSDMGSIPCLKTYNCPPALIFKKNPCLDWLEFIVIKRSRRFLN
ncbi:hypothetical protein ES703_72244 [subsurface metagenome]